MKTETQLCKEYGWSKKDIKMAREASVPNPDGIVLWTKKPSKKPKKLWSVMWTDDGEEFLKAFMTAKTVVDMVDEHIGPNGDKNGRLEEFTCTTGTAADLVGLEWEGVVVNNRFPNTRLIEVHHPSGIKVLAYCRDSRLWKIGEKVTVDSQRASHIVRSIPKKGFNR
jgi:hypothetical protein